MRSRDWSSDVCSSDLVAQLSANQADVFTLIMVGCFPSMVALCRGSIRFRWSLKLLQFRARDDHQHQAADCNGQTAILCSHTNVHMHNTHEIGRASRRERVCQYV